MFIFSLIYRALINEYGWRGTVLLQAGICFQGTVFGLLLLPPDKGNVADTNPKQDEKKQVMIERDNSVTNTKLSCDKTDNDILFVTDICKVDETVIEKDQFQFDETETKAEKDNRKQPLNWLLRSFRNLFDFTLFTNVNFLIFIMSVIAVHLAYSIVINMTVDRSVE